MVSFIIGVLSICLAGILPVQAQDSAGRDARVTSTLGQVTLRPAEKPDQALSVKGQTPLSEGDTLETGSGSRVEITLDGETVFNLQERSALQIKSLALQKTELALSEGALLAKVKPMTDPGQNLTVNMPTAVVAVRGTEFGVESRNGQTQAGVFNEGHVAVTGSGAGLPMMLSPNQETQVSKTGVPQAPHRLTHFQAYQSRMQHVRARAAYWHKNWKPMSRVKRQQIRQSLSRRQAAARNVRRSSAARARQMRAGQRTRFQKPVSRARNFSQQPRRRRIKNPQNN